MSDERQGEVKVVDRRWWARGDSDGTTDSAGARKPSYVEELEQQLGERGAHIQALAAEHRKALEEFEQVKLRLRRDVGREVERGRRAVILEFLDVLDNLQRAIDSASAASATDGLLRGIELVRDQFLAKLGALGVTKLDAVGLPFDATLHEAVTTAPVAAPADHGLVVAVLKDGFTIGDEVLRPASVVVGQHA